MKRFNYTGTCIPEKHYIADTSKKIEKITKMIDYGDYFTINRPRQYGKTTTIALLEKRLKEKYSLLSISFEKLGEESFENIEVFSKVFINNINMEIKKQQSDKLNIIEEKEASTFDELNSIMSNFIEERKA